MVRRRNKEPNMIRVKGAGLMLFWVLGVPLLHGLLGMDSMHWFWKVGMVLGGVVGLVMVISGKDITR